MPLGPLVLRATCARSDSLAGATRPSAWFRPCTREANALTRPIDSNPVPAGRRGQGRLYFALALGSPPRHRRRLSWIRRSTQKKPTVLRLPGPSLHSLVSGVNGHACALPHAPRRGLQRLGPFCCFVPSVLPAGSRPAVPPTSPFHTHATGEQGLLTLVCRAC